MGDFDMDLTWESGFDPPNAKQTLEKLLRASNTRLHMAMVASTAQMEREAVRHAPVDTGHLRGTIGSRTETGRRTITAELWANADYARHVELGTTQMTAQPFLRPALDSELPRLERRVRLAVAKAADSAGR